MFNFKSKSKHFSINAFCHLNQFEQREKNSKKKKDVFVDDVDILTIRYVSSDVKDDFFLFFFFL